MHSGHPSQPRFQGMMRKILRNQNFNWEINFTWITAWLILWTKGFFFFFFSRFSVARAGNPFTAVAAKSVLDPLCPPGEGWPSPKAAPRGSVPWWGLCGTPLPRGQCLVSSQPRNTPPASLCVQQQPCATEGKFYLHLLECWSWVWDEKTDYLSLWLPWLLLTAEVKPAVTPFQMPAP